jgi:hypothetical protein
MALPAEYDQVTVHGRYTYLNGTPVAGEISFGGKIFATAATSHTTIVPAPISVRLDPDGQFTIDLPATDDPDITPNGWTYTVTERFPGGRQYDIEVPVSAKNTGIDLSILAPVTAQNGSPTAFVTLTAYTAGLGTASANAAAAVTAANTANTNASTALTTANAASSTASTALSTANSVSANATAALTSATIARAGLFNVTAYGAVGDGSTNNDVAIAAALAAIPAQGGVLYFPRGTYNITAAIAAKSNLVIRGEGRSATRIMQQNVNNDGISNTTGALAYITIEDIDIRCTAATGTGAGIRLGLNSTASSYLSINRVNVQGFGSHGVYLGRWIASTITAVRSQGHGGHGFWIDRGTSYTLTGCYAVSCNLAGYYLSGTPLTYTSLVACAADSNGVGYSLDLANGITLVSCGNEAGVNRSTSYPGTGVLISNSNNIGLYQHYGYDNTDRGIYVTGTSVSILIAGYRDNTPRAGAGATSIKTDGSTRVTVIDPRLDGITDYAAGTVLALNVGTRTDLQASGSTPVVRGTTNTVGASNGQPIFQAIGADSANKVFGSQLGADANHRWMVDVTGRQEWGDGTSSRDAALYRSAAGILKTDTALTIAGELYTGPDAQARGYGTIYYKEYTASSSTNATTSQAVGFVTDSVTFRPNRAYQIELSGGVSSAAANSFIDVRLYKGSTVGGTTILEFFRQPITIANQITTFNPRRTFVCGSSTVTTTLTLGISSSTTSGVLLYATSTLPFQVTITDIGPSSKFPSAQQIV